MPNAPAVRVDPAAASVLPNDGYLAVTLEAARRDPSGARLMSLAK
jgi:hypothetical protein